MVQRSGPDAKTIHKYRKALAKRGVLNQLLREMEAIACEKGFEMRDGCMIDTSVVEVPVQHLQKDLDAKWVKKGSKSFFGYKRHVVVDVEHNTS